MTLAIVRRFVFLSIMLAASSFSSLTANTARAQTGWEYVPELGGYLDWDTGLVWGDHAWNVMSPKFTMTWNYANETYLPSYRVQTGITAWRLPTVAEAQHAAAQGIDLVIDNPISFIPCWTSQTTTIKGKLHAYLVRLQDGSLTTGFVETKKIKGSTGMVVPVYRAFTP